MTVFVKICGITNEEDALLAVAMGADAVGFVFAPSPRQVPPSLVGDIVKRLPPEILTVGVFRDESPERVAQIVHSTGLIGRAAPRQRVAGDGPQGRGVGAVRDQGVPRPAPLPFATRCRTAPTASSSTRPRPGSGELFDWSLAGEVPLRRAPDARRRPHPRQRGRRDRVGAAVGGGRVDRRRVRRPAARMPSRSGSSSPTPSPWSSRSVRCSRANGPTTGGWTGERGHRRRGVTGERGRHARRR